MGKKPAARQGSPMWVSTADLPKGAGHPFYERLNRALEASEFDAFVEGVRGLLLGTAGGVPVYRSGGGGAFEIHVRRSSRTSRTSSRTSVRVVRISE